MTETATCTLCATEPSSGFYTGCMVKDGHAPEWLCDGNGNLIRNLTTPHLRTEPASPPQEADRG